MKSEILNLNNDQVCKILKCSLIAVMALGKMALAILEAGGMRKDYPFAVATDMLEKMAEEVDEMREDL